MSLGKRAKLLSTVFASSDMKGVFTSMWIQAGNELDEVNLNSFKPRRKLDEAISQLCVILIERRHAKNTGNLNDVSVVMLVNSIDVFLTTPSLFKRTHFPQHAITPWNKQEREEES